ncbi:TetR/AcrR family transcriptional regulator [Pseudomonas sp. NA-150]|uniref:TetR/AcrR family transcriptional regulator n=1 Tax=Pseudomonas sp. NA-150 TaxID=3367525 RepID=UPI0037C8C8E1
MARPREFDEDQVLEQALLAFWKMGYEGTSLTTLLQATGLTKSSLYGAFVNKETLFHKVVERYHQRYLSFRSAALAEPTPRRVAERLLQGTIELHFGEHSPPGCLELNGALACSRENNSVRETLATNRNVTRQVLHTRFEQLKDQGPLPIGMSADSAANVLATLIQGMAVQAKSGATIDEMRDVMESFLLSWPKA